MPVDERVFDVLIVGGGPAGMAAASTAAAAGLKAALIDERPTLGGQVYKQPGPGMRVTNPRAMGAQYLAGRRLIDEVEQSGAEIVLSASVVDLEPAPHGWTAMVQREGHNVEPIQAVRVVIAAGANDRPVVFPGWTLPGVITAGGLQTLAKTQAVIPGKRIVFAGSGPVALAFPAQLASYGANIVTALESGPTPGIGDIAKVGLAAPGNIGLLVEAAKYRASLLAHKIPLKYGRIVVRAEGARRVERVVHAAVDRDWRVIPGTEETIDADVLCIGYGFAPSTELLSLVGCEFDSDEDLGGPVVRRDDWCRTDVVGIYAVGDGAGVEGSAVAADEGRLAAVAVARDANVLTQREAQNRASRLLKKVGRRRVLTSAAERMYRVGEGIFELATPDTTVCRCEGTTLAAVQQAIDQAPDVSAVKGLTRAGMGPCQGRMCGRHIASMIARNRGVPLSEVEPATPRMPIRPTPIGAIANPNVSDPGLFDTTAIRPTEPPRTDPMPANLTETTPGISQETDVLVIGGGIAGTAVAYYLAKEGVDVTLLERGELNREASGTNAGSFHFQLAIHQLSGKGTTADRDRLLGDARDSVRAYELWKGLSEELGADVGLHQTGGWMVAETAEQLQILRDKHLLETEAGIETEVLTGSKLKNRAPYFSDRVLGATYCGLEGHANPLTTAPLYAQRAAEAGGTIRTHTEVLSIEVNDASESRRFTVRTTQGTYYARRVVNCAAAWAGELAEMVGLNFPIRREGLHVNVTEARPKLLPSMVQHIGRRLTLKQTSQGGFIVGGGWPTGASAFPTRYPTKWQSASGNLNVARDVIPSLDGVRVIRTWSGVIAFTDDKSPIVGESAIVPGYYACVATTGFTFSPIFAYQLSEQILDRHKGSSPFPERFSLDRMA
ncbi:glycine/D-amino acid oxidase-like deaminating enzyme [Rhodoglobus vestalii]|uniref:Glycine/D-amino acid oxidase-like deaminating enzyme n=1 Tax=Rhodoglobus vestalii TaxID=193384 RepID=A0A8H2PYJ5_9MICO|nr:glycine/D-amino acid oxidase-like deaminating enzyme [Rhodoglobus vestalii]